MQRRDFIKSISLATLGLSATQLYAFHQITDTSKGQINVLRPECEIPVIYDVDVLIIGGTSAGVTAAVSSKRNGAKVCLITGDTYLGADICGTYNYWQKPQNKGCLLAQKIWNNSKQLPTPLHVKTTFDNALIDNDIPFLLSSYVGNILFDKKNNPAGVIIANRSGEQIIKAKIIIDATMYASVAQLAGVEFTKFKKGNRKFTFRTLGNNPKSELNPQTLSPPVKHKDKTYQATEYQLEIPIQERNFAQYAEAEQIAIDKTWDIEQVDASTYLSEIPQQKIVAKSTDKNSDLQIDAIDINCFKPKNVERLIVLSAYASISDEAALQLMTKSEDFMLLGRKIGKTAATEAKNISQTEITGLKNQEKITLAENKQAQQYILPMRKQHHIESLKISSENIPVWGEFEVLVVGGGTAGASAGIASARDGADTLVVEYTHGLGGMGTMGLIGRYWHGYREGFSREIDQKVKELAPENHPRQKKKDIDWVREWKMEWYRQEIRKAGGKIWFGAIACGAVVEKNTLKGIVIATPFGKGIVLAQKIIDATGSADIAIAAGSDYQFIDKKTLAIQGAGMPRINPNDYYNNSDWTFIDDTDVFDITRSFVSANKKHKGSYDTGTLPQTRERRRIVSEYQVTAQDMLNNRTYPDTISYHISSFDTHGFTISPIFTINPPKGSSVDMNAYVPIRTLLPKKLENILVTGLGADAHRDAMPVIRMQPCLQNQGYNVGLLASMATKEGKTFREFDLKKLQPKLVEKGTLPKNVLTDKDNYPTDKAKIKASIDNLKNDIEEINFILWNKELSLPLVEEKLESSKDNNEKVLCAYILGLHGIDTGWQVLKEKIDSYTNWDEGWNYTGMGQFGKSSSYLDGLIMALGQTKHKEALPSIHRLANKLDINSEFSHFRAIAVALESIKSSESVDILAELINMPGIKNYATTTIEEARFFTVPGGTDTSTRNKALREIVLARALYRCGDKNELAKNILVDYSNDLHGIYALHSKDIINK